LGQHGGKFATAPLGGARVLLEGILVDEAVEVLFEFARHFAWSPRTWAIQQALRSLLGKALHPFAQSRIRKVKGYGDGMDVMARNDLTDGLCAAKDPGFLRLREHGV
jgi:hypothetical protein